MMKFLHALLGRSVGEQFGQCLRSIRDEAAIEEEQRLLRNGRLVAHCEVDVGIGEVKRAEYARQKLPIHEGIDRAAFVPRFEEFRRHPAHGQIEFTTHREHRIADLLELQTAGGEVREEAVVRISNQ